MYLLIGKRSFLCCWGHCKFWFKRSLSSVHLFVIISKDWLWSEWLYCPLYLRESTRKHYLLSFFLLSCSLFGASLFISVLSYSTLTFTPFTHSDFLIVHTFFFFAWFSFFLGFPLILVMVSFNMHKFICSCAVRVLCPIFLYKCLASQSGDNIVKQKGGGRFQYKTY